MSGKAKIGIVLFVIIALVTISYFHLWLIVLSIIFLGFVLVEVVTEYYGLFKVMKLDNLFEKDFSTVVHFSFPMNSKMTLFRKVKMHLFLFFNSVNNGICWPVLFLYGMRSDKIKFGFHIQNAALMRIKPLQIYFAFYYLFVSIVIAVLFYFKLINEKYIFFYSSVFAVGLVCLLLTFLISEENFASIFKNSPGSILKGVSLVCLYLTLSIFILFCIILAVYYHSQLNSEIVKKVFNYFFKQETFGLLWKRKFEEIKLVHLLISLSGLLFAATIIDTLKNFKSFKRGVVNYKAISNAYLYRKEYNSSLEWLQKMQRQSWDLSCWKSYMVILVGLNQIDKAIDCFIYTHILDDESDFPEDHKYCDLISVAKSYAIDPMLINSIYTRWIPNCKCDGILFLSVFHALVLSTDEYEEGVIRAFSEASVEGGTDRLVLSNKLIDLVNNEWSLDKFVDILKNETRRQDSDVLSRSIAHLYLIGFCFDHEIELENEFKRLSEFEKSVENLSKPRDVVFVLLTMVGMLKMMQARASFYQSALFVYNNMKQKISNSPHIQVVNSMDYVLKKATFN